MSTPRQLLKNVGALAAARGLTSVLTLVTMVYLARMLRPDAFGMLSWAMVYQAYFKLLPDFGLGVYGQREAARSPERLPGLVSHILPLRMLLAAATFIAYLGLLAVLNKPPLFTTVVAVQGLGLFGFAITLEWVYLGIERMEVLAVRNVVAAVLTLAVVLLLVRSPDQVVVAAAATVLGVVGGGVWLLFTYRREFGPFRLRPNRKAWAAMLVPTLPIAAAHALSGINVNMDQLMLGLIRTEQEVGWYSAAYRLLLAGTIPAQILLQAFLPSLSAAFGHPDVMRERARQFATAIFASGFPIAAGSIAFSHELIGLFGPSYAPAVPAFSVLMVHCAMSYMNTLFACSLLAWDRQRLYMFALLGGALANVVLNFVLIPSMGITGAALATLCSEIIVFAIAVIFHYRVVGQLYLGPLLRAAAATAAATGAVLLLRTLIDLPFVVDAVLMVVLYVAAAYAVGLADVKGLLDLARQRST